MSETLPLLPEEGDGWPPTWSEGRTKQELERTCVPPDAPGHPTEAHSVLQCLHVILDEEWEHSRYANRDLDILEARPR